jgi:hypothetical protein
MMHSVPEGDSAILFTGNMCPKQLKNDCFAVCTPNIRNIAVIWMTRRHHGGRKVMIASGVPMNADHRKGPAPVAGRKSKEGIGQKIAVP